MRQDRYQFRHKVYHSIKAIETMDNQYYKLSQEEVLILENVDKSNVENSDLYEFELSIPKPVRIKND